MTGLDDYPRSLDRGGKLYSILLGWIRILSKSSLIESRNRTGNDAFHRVPESGFRQEVGHGGTRSCL